MRFSNTNAPHPQIDDPKDESDKLQNECSFNLRRQWEFLGAVVLQSNSVAILFTDPMQNVSFFSLLLPNIDIPKYIRLFAKWNNLEPDLRCHSLWMKYIYEY